MSAWRRKALALFPEFRDRLTRPDYESFELFHDLVRPTIAAHLANDRDLLRRVYGYVEWALHQPGRLWNEAALGFYEDLLRIVGGVPWDQVVPWLSPFAVTEIKRTWALGIEGEDAPRLDGLLETRRERLYEDHVYSTGEIEPL